MAEVQTIERHQTAAPTNFSKTIFTALIGAAIGAIAWGGGVLIARFIIEPVFCATPDSASICDSRNVTSFNIALALASFIGLLVMIRARIYRPLLIALAAAVTLWGLASFLTDKAWFIGLLWTILLSALGYALFGWIAQLRSFIAALVVTVVAVVVVRLIPSL